VHLQKAESNIYIVMDYCSGGDLSNYIRERGKVDTLQYIPEPGAAPIYYPHPKTGGLDQRMVRSFLMQLATALKFLRDRNLIHRDLKPQVSPFSSKFLFQTSSSRFRIPKNLLLQPATEEDYAHGHLLGAPLLKVADFGFARFLPNTALAETLCGSP
jgi:serine/threonine-protein kinase ULK2